MIGIQSLLLEHKNLILEMKSQMFWMKSQMFVSTLRISFQIQTFVIEMLTLVTHTFDDRDLYRAYAFRDWYPNPYPAAIDVYEAEVDPVPEAAVAVDPVDRTEAPIESS